MGYFEVMKEKPWQVRLFENSLMKKEKVRLVSRLVRFSEKEVLDLGCSNGTVSFYLKRNGGRWFHTDLDFENLVTAGELLEGNLFQIPETAIPSKAVRFDIVVALDFLEHLEADEEMVREIHRVLKPGGTAVISTPVSGGFFLLNRLKKKVGLTPEIYGHKREGYSLRELNRILENNGFRVTRAATYSKFLVEFFEILLNTVYTRAHKIKKAELRSGAISPSSAKDLEKNRKLFKIYSRFIYPLIFLGTRLDKLLWFKTGYATLVTAEKI